MDTFDFYFKFLNQKSIPNIHKTISSAKFDRYTVDEVSMQGFRKEMEDEHLISSLSISGHHILGIFDGHSGNKVSKHIKNILVDMLERNRHWLLYKRLLELNYVEDEVLIREKFEILKVGSINTLIKKSLEETFMDIDRTIVDSDFGFEPAEMLHGSTANVVLLTPTNYYCANTGDSRAILIRSRDIIPLSVDHKPSNKLEEERIVLDGGFVFNSRVDGKLGTSRSFGDFLYKTFNMVRRESRVTAFPDVTITTKTVQDNYLILACDGVWDVNSNDELYTSLRDIRGNLTHYRNEYRKLMREFYAKISHQLFDKVTDQEEDERLSRSNINQYFSGLLNELDRSIFYNTEISKLTKPQINSLITQILCTSCCRSGDNVSLMIVKIDL